ncbi:hypothetical protein PENTCL1PPCAC_29060, partial [Pristionchus entomophagus]
SVQNDYEKLIASGNQTNDTFNRSEFEDLIRMRCQDNDDCYREEFVYFSSLYLKTTHEPNDRLSYFQSKLNRTKGDEILAI